jgi:hypothetical protein
MLTLVVDRSLKMKRGVRVVAFLCMEILGTLRMRLQWEEQVVVPGGNHDSCIASRVDRTAKCAGAA